MNKQIQQDAGKLSRLLQSKGIKLPYNTALEVAAQLGGARDLHEAQKRPTTESTGNPEILSLAAAYKLLTESIALITESTDGETFAVTHTSDGILTLDGEPTKGIIGAADNPFAILGYPDDEQVEFWEGDNETVVKIGSSLFLKSTDNEEIQVTLLGYMFPNSRPDLQRMRVRAPKSEAVPVRAPKAQVTIASIEALIKDRIDKVGPGADPEIRLDTTLYSDGHRTLEITLDGERPLIVDEDRNTEQFVSDLNAADRSVLFNCLVASTPPIPACACPHCHADLTEKESVSRRYDDKDHEGNATYSFGHYGKDGFFEPDGSMLVGPRFDLNDDSDDCVACGKKCGSAQPVPGEIKPSKAVDPIDLIKVYLTEDGGILLDKSATRHEGTITHVRADADDDKSVLTEGSGFEILVFDDSKRFKGARDLLPLLTGSQDDVSWVTRDLKGGLYAIAIRTPYDTLQTWTDLRGNKVRKES